MRRIAELSWNRQGSTGRSPADPAMGAGVPSPRCPGRCDEAMAAKLPAQYPDNTGNDTPVTLRRFPNVAHSHHANSPKTLFPRSTPTNHASYAQLRMSAAVPSNLRIRAISINWTSALSCPELFGWERDMAPEARTSVELRGSPRRQGVADCPSVSAPGIPSIPA